ncbi:uncharacterized protein LOC111624393 [Centruroides sculpturatus]|uniref:uncharacterized protein LOC111624393 n=1 Tax=Centruroides sculpturatus TaxID=218467 RepID=UPI000C6EABAA|nr:uncharacterized protein LOC111624393 [Centruroides sculpturatus]
MSVFNRFARERQIVWEWVSQFLCWEYCAQLIEQDPEENKLYPKIESEFFQQLVESSIQDKEDFTFYRTLVKYLKLTNHLLDENVSNDEFQCNLETCLDCLNEICCVYPQLKYFGHHLNKLFQEIRIDLSYQERCRVWKTVFNLSQSCLLNEILELLPKPYILNFINGFDLNKHDAINDRSFIDKVVEFIKNLPLEKKDFNEIKELLLEDERIRSILNENTSANNNNRETSSPDGSYQSAVSNLSDTLVNEIVTEKEMHVEDSDESDCIQDKEICQQAVHPDETIVEINNKTKEAFKSSYFQTPAPLQDLKTVLRRNAIKQKMTIESDNEFENLNRSPSPTSSISSSGSVEGAARKRMPWSMEEEELLVAGVQKYGTGHWKFIISDGGLYNRTPRDLYDKWKNINKYNHLDMIKARLRKRYVQ